MDLLSAYNDSDEEEPTTTTNTTETSTAPTINNTNNNNNNKSITSFKPSSLAPLVTSIRVIENKINPNDKILLYNPTVESMEGDIFGPKKPFSSNEKKLDSKFKNHTNGIVEDYHINDYAFNQQVLQFKNRGYSENPNNSSELIGHRKDENNSENKNSNNDNNNNSNNKNKDKRKRNITDDPSNINGYLGPWGTTKAEFELKQGRENDMVSIETNLTEQQRAFMDSRVKKQKGKDEEDDDDSKSVGLNTSIFHGKVKKDYMGRSWLDPPSDLRLVTPDTFIPKKLVHSYTGHTKGVAAIRYIPKYGHLLLSAGMDNTVKIWDAYGDRRCIQTYMGHSQAVRDICFSNDGRRFLSCGYDRQTRLWDTETGKILNSFSNGKIPYCIKFNPDDDKQDQFLSGGSDKKIIQWDIKSNEIVQEYDQHLGSVNTITFLDDNRRFVTSSDDKSLRVWDWGIPVVIKYISDPSMHSMPAVALHPKGKWFAAQSLDNQILIYSARDRFRMNKKKRFLGHNVSGYACQLSFSPDGKFICSGDSTGKAFFWDWKTSKIVKTINAHNNVCIGIEWSPLEPSKVITCSWNNEIKLWD
ncbi:hypothetical protein RB653_008960 [Dictyostelium firmibasis]|uniref:Pre-mRNA-processing factor 17 n=1 Tax=Dictyostelium firmibasis TaxID=79012 RepID=A0AAN7TTC7_9MYCE